MTPVSNQAANHHKVIIIGSGPAGYTAAIYAARANLEPVMFEGPQPGGQLTITTDVENFPGFANGILGPQLMEDMKAQAKRFGTVIHNAWVTAVDLAKRPFTITTDSATYTADTLIIATGATAKLMNLPGEKELMGHGVSACATCDGFFFRGKDVVIVGGGDSAMEEAMFLTKFANKVSVVHRRDELRASKIMQYRAKANPKIEFVWNSEPTEILGSKDNGVHAVMLKDTVTGETREFATQGLFYAIGHKPNTDLIQGQLELHDNGYIKVQPGTPLTSVPGVFAAGDVADHHYRQAITAAGSGCMAAMDAEKFLEG